MQILKNLFRWLILIRNVDCTSEKIWVKVDDLNDLKMVASVRTKTKLTTQKHYTCMRVLQTEPIIHVHRKRKKEGLIGICIIIVIKKF